MQINFYHLTKSPVGKALPRLLEKVLTSGVKTIVLAPDEKRTEELNRDLWTYTTKVFLPHGSKNDGFSDEQPIYLTAGNENPNGATVLAIVEGANSDNINAFEKCLYMFDGTDDSQLKTARQRWKEYNNAGHSTIYWQQNSKGGWESGNS